MMPQDGEFELNISIGTATFSGSGDTEHVMAAFDRFAQLVSTAPLSGSQQETGEVVEEGAGQSAPARSGERVVLPVFLQQTRHSGNAETAAAIAAWSAIHDGKPSLSTSEIRELWRGTTLRAPGNLPRDVSGAVRAGLLHKEGREYSITGYGRQKLGLPTE